MADTRSSLRADLLVLLAMFFPTLGAWYYFVHLEGSALARPAYIASKVVQFTIPLLWIVWTRRKPRALLDKRGIAAGLLSGLVMGATLLLIWYWRVQDTTVAQIAVPKIQAKLADFRIETPLGYLGMALALSCLHSLLEEFYWRWFVYQRLRVYLPSTVAAVIGSVAFASHHVIVLASFVPVELFWSHAAPAAAAVGVGGLLWCALLERYGSLSGAWLSHMLVDLALMAAGAIMLFF